MAQGRWSSAPLLLAAVLVAMGARGEQVYRCEVENGLVYQDLPCEGPGEVIEVPSDPPNPEEVERMRRRQAEMRALINEATQERLRREAVEAMKVPEVIIIQPRVEQRSNDNDVRILDRCPLGLGNCPKPAAPVFRRPNPDRQTPAAPLGLNRGRGEATEEAAE